MLHRGEPTSSIISFTASGPASPHNRRSGIIDSYRPDLRRFAAGPYSEILLRAIWAGYGTQVVYELTVTVGAGLAKMLGPALWSARIEPAIAAFDGLQRDHPLDPAALGFTNQGT